MTKYFPNKVELNKTKAKKMISAIEKGEPLTLRFKYTDFNDSGRDLLFTKTQLKQIADAVDKQKGIDVKFSKSQLNAMRKDGGVLPALAPLAAVAGPLALALATGAAGAVGKFATDKIIEAIDKPKAKPRRGKKGNALVPFGAGLFPFGVTDSR